MICLCRQAGEKEKSSCSEEQELFENILYASGQQLLVVNLCHVLDEHQQFVGVAPLNLKR